MTQVRAWWKNLGGVAQAFFVGLCLLVMLNLGIIFFGGKIGQQEFKNPLSDYSKQVVVDQVRNGDPVTIEGRRCNSYNLPINVTYAYSWKTTDPDDNISIPGSSGAFEMAPGCVNGTTAYTMPPGVFEYTKAQIKGEVDGVKWYIEALETPIDDEGNLGQIKYWRTNDFEIVTE